LNGGRKKRFDFPLESSINKRRNGKGGRGLMKSVEGAIGGHGRASNEEKRQSAVVPSLIKRRQKSRRSNWKENKVEAIT